MLLGGHGHTEAAEAERGVVLRTANNHGHEQGIEPVVEQNPAPPHGTAAHFLCLASHGGRGWSCTAGKEVASAPADPRQRGEIGEALTRSGRERRDLG